MIYLNLVFEINTTQFSKFTVWSMLYQPLSNINNILSMSFLTFLRNSIVYGTTTYYSNFVTFSSLSLFILIKSYLTDRFFQIHIFSCTSQMAIINAIVPKGGILSLLLFIHHLCLRSTSLQSHPCFWIRRRKNCDFNPWKSLKSPTQNSISFKSYIFVVHKMENQIEPQLINTHHLYFKTRTLPTSFIG